MSTAPTAGAAPAPAPESTLERVDRAVREAHATREGHPAEGYWTDRTTRNGRMMPRRFVPTCCGRR